MKSFISLFTGGGGADIGAIAAGLIPVAGLELDAAIADVARQNIDDHIRWGAVQEANYTTFPAAFWLHASPPCTTASRANSNGGETALDMAMAQGICQAITTIRPRRFSLENVYGYRTYAAFSAILTTLHAEGYAVSWWHLNSASYGVPQTRQRLILVASLDHTPRRPQPTHCNPARINHNQLAMFSLPPWIGWYAAIEDILHTLPDSQFAPWQLARLPAKLRTLLIAGANTGQEWGKGYREGSERFATLSASAKMPRALLVPGANDFRVRDQNRTAQTITENADRTRAFILDDQNASTAEMRDSTEPVHTITSTVQKSLPRACIGRVVSATPRALARWQSVPDSYVLPEKTSLACKIIGNMIPPLLMQRVIEANLC